MSQGDHWAHCLVKREQERAQVWDLVSNKILNNPSRCEPQSPKGVVEVMIWRQQTSFFQQDSQRPSISIMRSCPETWHLLQRPGYRTDRKLSSSLVLTIHAQLVSPTSNILFKPTPYPRPGFASRKLQQDILHSGADRCSVTSSQELWTPFVFLLTWSFTGNLLTCTKQQMLAQKSVWNISQCSGWIGSQKL